MSVTYALVDEDVVSTVQLTDSEIVEAIVTVDNAEESDDDDVSYVEKPPVLFDDAVKSLEKVRQFLHQCKDVGWYI